jgi:hypothetical protein
MTTKNLEKLYYTLSSMDLTRIERATGAHYENLGEVAKAQAELYQILVARDPSFAERDYQLALAELEIAAQAPNLHSLN